MGHHRRSAPASHSLTIRPPRPRCPAPGRYRHRRRRRYRPIWEPSKAIAQARELRKAGKYSEALLEYDKAIAGRPNDARLLIERGRLLAFIGQAAKADADFQTAARARTRQSPALPRSWLVGRRAISQELRQGRRTRKIVRAPDPSKPAPPSKNETLRWHETPTEANGFVDFGKLFKANNVVAYAMTVVYSTERREVVLLAGSDDAARVWINGKQAYDLWSYTVPESRAVLFTLEPGRNAIVTRVSNDTKEHGFSLRFGTMPVDFGRAYVDAKPQKWKEAAAEFAKSFRPAPDIPDPVALAGLADALVHLERWKDAKPVFERIAALDPNNFGKQSDLLRCYLALKDYPSYRRVCEAQIARHGKTQNRDFANNVIWLAALIPAAVHSYDEVRAIGDKLTNSKSVNANEQNTYGCVLYRVGKYDGSINLLNKSIASKKGHGNAWDYVFTAMARHRLGKPGDREALAQARQAAKDPAMNWQNRVEISALIEEAEGELKLPVGR